MIALCREVSASFDRALTRHALPAPIDVARARAQHAAYVAALRQAGAEVIVLPAEDAMPDACFVEDTAVVAGGLALVTRPGAPSRQAEPPAVAAALARHVPTETMHAPATLDGGDCLRLGTRLYVGRSARTNAEGLARARAVFAHRGVTVAELPVEGALHLKSVCSPLGDDVVLVAEGALRAGAFGGARELVVPAEEAPAANAVTVGRTALVAAGFPRTARLVAAAGYEVLLVDNSELRKADSALTCLSIVIGSHDSTHSPIRI